MSVGDYVIANDLLGVVLGEQDAQLLICDCEGEERLINKDACRELVSSYALAASVYVKLRRKANSEKNKG